MFCDRSASRAFVTVTISRRSSSDTRPGTHPWGGCYWQPQTSINYFRHWGLLERFSLTQPDSEEKQMASCRSPGCAPLSRRHTHAHTQELECMAQRLAQRPCHRAYLAARPTPLALASISYVRLQVLPNHGAWTRNRYQKCMVGSNLSK